MTTSPGHCLHAKLMINEITLQIRFLVSSTKYLPIPIKQKEGDPSFAPMQIVVSTVSWRILLYIYAQLSSVYIHGPMDSHFWLMSCIGWWCPYWIYIHALTRQILKHHFKLYLHPFMLWWVTAVVMLFQGSIKGDGLGLLAWWSADEEEAAAEQ